MSERAPLSFAQSEHLYAEACKVYAGGTTQSKRPELFIEGEYPLFAARGEGAYLWDVDGNRFLDWMLGLGIVVLGHRDPEVDEAAIREIREGFAFAMTRPVQNTLAQLLVEIIPCAELVHFFKAGSDATSAAVRLARIWTGRDKVVRWGYNGWHDWCNPYDAGIPRHVRDDILTFEYNNLDALKAVLNRNEGQVACIIMMPLEAEAPQPGFPGGREGAGPPSWRTIHSGRDAVGFPHGAGRCPGGTIASPRTWRHSARPSPTAIASRCSPAEPM